MPIEYHGEISVEPRKWENIWGSTLGIILKIDLGPQSLLIQLSDVMNFFRVRTWYMTIGTKPLTNTKILYYLVHDIKSII